MLDIITKKEYWQWLDAGWGSGRVDTFKNVEDAYILSKLHDKSGLKILEIGGGDSRILKRLAEKNECWLADKFEGLGLGPVKLPDLPGVKKIVQVYVGDFSPELPDGYFDCLFSISVVEHVVTEKVAAFFRDCARLLKPGGVMYHAIDLYVTDTPVEWSRSRLQAYLAFADRPEVGLRLVGPAAITPDLTFSCRFATVSDNQFYYWNRVAPTLTAQRETHRGVCVKGEWIKSAPA